MSGGRVWVLISFLLLAYILPHLMRMQEPAIACSLCYQSPSTDDNGEQWYELRTELSYRPDKSCGVRVVFKHDVWTDVHFYFYNNDSAQLVMYTKLEAPGYLLDVSAVPDPVNPDQELLLFYTAAQYPIGHLWRVDPERRRIRVVLEGTYLDTAYLVTKRLVTEWIPAHYVLAEGRYDFQLMAKRLWKWDDKRGRFIPSWWYVAESTYRFFNWMDKIMDQFDKLGTPCAPPEPVPAGKMARFVYPDLWLKAYLNGSVYYVQLAYDGYVAYFSVYKPLAKGRKLLRCTRLEWSKLPIVERFRLPIAVRTVSAPDNSRRSLIVAYDETGQCMVWRINPETMRPVVVMRGYFLDVSQIHKGIVKEWEQALSLVKDAGWDAYPPAFRNPKAMAYRVWRWDKRKQRFVVASSWRIGKWSRADYRRFGFWE